MSCECRGSGWLEVDEEYVDRLAPLPDPSSPEYETVRLKRAGLRNTVKPCPAHNWAGYARWLVTRDEDEVPRSVPPPPELRRELSEAKPATATPEAAPPGVRETAS